MRKPGQGRAESSAKTREAILDAAFERFREGGLGAVTLRTIAEASGSSPMGIYRHFDNREAIVNALVDRGLEMLREEMQTVRRDRGLTTVRRLMRVYMEFALSHPDMFDLIFLTHRESSDPFLDEYKGGMSPSFEILRHAVEDAVRTGELAPLNSVDAAVSLWAQAHGLVALYVAGRFGKGEELFKRFFVRSLNRMIDGMRASHR
jgi:AcrR family transcriptional regulator